MKNIVNKLLCCLLALLLGTGAALADNATIAVQGQDGFDDYVSGMTVWGDKLLLLTWDTMYLWQEGEGLTMLEGYSELQNVLYESMTTDEENGTVVYTIGETEIELDQEQGISLYGEIVPAGDTIYRRAAIYGPDGDEGCLLIELVIGEDGAASFGEVIDLEDQMTVDYGDGYVGSREIVNPCAFDGILYCLSYGENGRELLAIDLEEAEVNALPLDVEGEIVSVSAFTAGKLLLVELDYNVDPMETNLLCYDIEAEEASLLGALPSDNLSWNTPCAILYDEARGMLYYTLSGSVWRMSVTEAGLGQPQEFGDMPLEAYSDSAAVLLGDLYIVSAYDGVVGRDVTISQLPEQRLRVDNGAYIESIRQAYYPFTDQNPAYMVSIQSGSGADNILQDMMNRSPDVDIYTMSMSDSAFFALYNRGFMAELGASDAIRAYTDALYESLSSEVTREGEIYAVPMTLYTGAQAINKTLLTDKLGYGEEDMPTSWPQLFALLSDIASSGKLEEYPEVSILSPGYTQRDARFNFFNSMLESYFLWLDQSEENLMRGSEVLLEVCRAFETIDWAALGLPEEFDFEDDMAWEYVPENILFENTSVQPRYYYEEAMEPVVLAIAEGEPQLMGLEVTAVFVNPFSQHREMAIAYLEQAIALMDETERIALMPGENTPIESRYYEENLASYDETIAELEAQLKEQQEADDPDEEAIDMLTGSLEDFRSYREEYMETGRWEVSEADIARYRKYASYGVVTRASVWSSGAYTQIAQYLDGAMTAQQLASELEKTLQMQRLEGM